MVLPDIDAARNFNFYKQHLKRNAGKVQMHDKTITEVDEADKVEHK